MSREPSLPTTERPEQTEQPEQTERELPRAAGDDAVADDDIWVTRWKNEGGAWLPTD